MSMKYKLCVHNRAATIVNQRRSENPCPAGQWSDARRSRSVLSTVALPPGEAQTSAGRKDDSLALGIYARSFRGPMFQAHIQQLYPFHPCP